MMVLNGALEEIAIIVQAKLDLRAAKHGFAEVFDDFAALLEGKDAQILTDIGKSLMSHQMCYAAEESRRNGGKTVLL